MTREEAITLTRWLKDRRLFTKFMNNLQSPANQNGISFNNLIYRRATNDCFTWANTPEGREFWSKIDFLWRDFVNTSIAGKDMRENPYYHQIAGLKYV